MDVYHADAESLRLDEQQLAAALGVSRTPVRQALARLDHEGLVRIVPRRGVYIVRKSKDEIVEMITAWAALESMAARLVCERATDAEIASLRALFSTFEDGDVRLRLNEYSEANFQLPPAHPRARPGAAAREHGQRPAGARPRDPRQHDRRRRSRRALDRRPHRTSSRRSRTATPSSPSGWCANTRSRSPPTSSARRRFRRTGEYKAPWPGTLFAPTGTMKERRRDGHDHRDTRKQTTAATEVRDDLGWPLGGEGTEGRGHRRHLHPLRRPHHRHLRRLHRRGHPGHRRPSRAGGGARRRRVRARHRPARLRRGHRRPRHHRRHRPASPTPSAPRARCC